ncbi:MAG TPA: ScyD/ScyE family protein [Pseudomonadales bacterium]
MLTTESKRSFHRRMSQLLALAAVVMLALAFGSDASARGAGLHGRLLTSGLAGASGATVGPDGALYAVEGALGQVVRIDPRSGRKRIFATGLPPAIPEVGIGGAIDVAFIGRTAYVLVTLLGEFGAGVDGIYRITGPDTWEIVADLGTFSRDNPPPTAFDLAHGVQFAMQPIDQGFLVSDGHHNRILHVTLDGAISVLKQYDNVVPTGLAGEFGTVYVAELGPVPNLPEDGKVTSFPLLAPGTDRAAVASGVSMIVDVELGPDGALYALSQGDIGSEVPGAPAAPNTGRLLQVKKDGTFKVLARRIDRPTSLDFACGRAHVTTLTGQVLQFNRLDWFLAGLCL